MPKKKRKPEYNKKDPFFERERQKYERPVPSREFILEYLKDYGRPASRSQLIKAFGLDFPDEQEALRRRLIAMLRDGQLFSNRRHFYALIDQMEMVPARVIGHAEGFGFARPDNGEKDVYLSPSQMQRLFPGDKVLIRVSTGRRGRREGFVVEILERSTQQVVGRYFEESGVSFVEPDHKKITQTVLIPASARGGAKPGQLVVASILAQPSTRRQAMGEVIEILGEHMQPGLETELAIRSFNIPFEWPLSVKKAIEALGKKVSASDMENREDLRHIPFVTIDGEDAKDFDDAVYCQPKPKGGWRLMVAIADVTHYVKPESALDAEAAARGNSVYFPGRTVPMLPEALSNELCSLKPHVNRLSLVCDMSVSASGKVTSYRFYRAVICSKARLTYTEVADVLSGKVARKHEKWLPEIHALYDLYQVLHQQRKMRGALDFDLPETRIVFTKNRKIKEINVVLRNDAHRLIEECMLLANISAATFLSKHKIPVLYRVHEGPDDEKLGNLRAFLKGLGLRLEGGEQPSTLDYAKLLESTKDRADARLIQTVVLRSLKQAKYTPELSGHFGLSYDAYTHFTSPIRRYPDILVHRAICRLVDQKEKAFEYDAKTMYALGEHFSMTERRADEATRDVVAWLKCEYMLDKQGECFRGVISAVTNFGLFVELNDIFVEGLLHVSALPNDYYHFDSINHRLIGKHSGTQYTLGAPLFVKVARVDLDHRQIDLDLNET